MFSERSRVPSQPNSWGQLLEKARRRDSLIDLTQSNPTRTPPLPGTEAALGALARVRGAAHYDPAPFGMPEARSVAAATQPWPVAAEHTLLTASTSEAYGFLLRLLCDPGDEVLVPRPGYPLLDELARLDGVELRHYELAYDGAWHLDEGSVARAMTERTRAIVVVHPNNPTGHYMTRHEVAALARFGLPLISDEVFRLFPHVEDRAREETLLGTPGAMVFCLDGLSKRAALPQLKLGWCSVSGPAPWVNEALRRLENIADSYLSVATPIQRALAELLPHGDVNRLALLERIRHNRDQLRTCVAGSAATLLSLEGGWYAILRLPETHSADQWAQLLVDAGVLVQPGWLFDLEGSYVVLSLIVDPLQFEVGARRLVDCVQRAS